MPASGKLTCAKRLAEADADTVLLDDHFFFDFVAPFIDNRDYKAWGTAKFHDLAANLRIEFIKILSGFHKDDAPRRYVFTTVLFDPKRIALIDALDAFAKDLGGEFFPIYLRVRPDALKSRCATNARAARGKLCRPDQYDSVFGGRFEQAEFSHPNRLVLDSSDLSEDETFSAIKKHLSL